MRDLLKLKPLNSTIMEKFQTTINHAEIKRNAIAKAKEAAGKDINKAIKLAKKFYE